MQNGGSRIERYSRGGTVLSDSGEDPATTDGTSATTSLVTDRDVREPGDVS